MKLIINHARNDSTLPHSREYGQRYITPTYSLYSQRRLVKIAVAPAICNTVVPRSCHSTFSIHSKPGLISLSFRSDVRGTMSITRDPKERAE